MAFATLDQVGLKISKTGQECDVPNHPQAKLMYYLSCMCDVLQLNQTEHVIKRFANYKKILFPLQGGDSCNDIIVYSAGSCNVKQCPLNAEIKRFIKLAYTRIIILKQKRNLGTVKRALMTFHFDHMNLEVEDEPVCTVPNNPKAKLMYYLQSMCAVLQLDQTDHDIRKFTNYQKYYLLSDEETAAMVLLCTMLDPVTLNDVCIFHDEDACGNLQNEFFEIEAKRCKIAATRSVMVGNVQVAIKKFMCYKMVWIEENYIEPLRQLFNIIQKTNSNSSERCCSIL